MISQIRKIGLVFLLALVPLQQAFAKSEILGEITGDQFTPDMVYFDPAVFRIDSMTGAITTMCVPSNGVWLRVDNTPTPCPKEPGTDKPLASLQVQPFKTPEDAPMFLARDFGITTEEWHKIHDGTAPPALQKLSKAVDVNVGGDAVHWRFNSAELPDTLRNEIPGSGTHFHFGFTYSHKNRPFVMQQPGDALLIETKLAFPRLKLTGEATNGLTIGIVLQQPDINGEMQPITYIVDLFSMTGKTGERMASDGRVAFAESTLSNDVKFLVPVEGRLMSEPWKEERLFAFQLNAETLQHLIDAFNKGRIAQGAAPFTTDLSKLRLKSVTLRNECRFLDRGSVDLALAAEGLRVSRVRN